MQAKDRVHAAILVVSTLAQRSSRRLVIYHVDAEALESTLRDLFQPATFFQTLDGYEDRTHATRGQIGQD